jgi:deoxyribonuclease-4
MLIGAHVSTRGKGVRGVIDAARAAGADAVQAWGSNPRAWAPPHIDDRRADGFREEWRASGLGALFLHAPYMVNVASPDAGFRSRSVALAAATVELGDAIGADGVVIHAGAAGTATARRTAVARAAGSIMRVAATADHVHVLVELMAGTAGAVASSFEEARELLDACAERGRLDRVGLCLDTCHLFAAGYPLDTAAGVRATLRELRGAGLSSRLQLIHANDSKYPRGEHRDAHTHIGAGHIGDKGFAALLHQPAIRRVPVVCETPGSARDTARNVATLRRLAS